MNWTKENIHELVEKQKEYFLTNETFDLKFRKRQLIKLRDAIANNKEKIEEALYKDLGRSKVESYLLDTGVIIMEINEIIHNLKKWAKPELHFSGLAVFPSIFTRLYKIPYGTTLIISPYNFPFLLSVGVLAASISGGNTAILKCSSKSKYSTEALIKIIGKIFDPKYVAVVDGGHDIADFLLEEKVNKIFYTGSPNVGKHVMELASKNLTPVALELGGENGNWAVVRKDANIKDAARKIAWMKICNSGQICININQVAVASEVADEFVSELKKEFERQIGKDPLNNPEYGKLIGNKAFEFCEGEANKYKDRTVYGGKGNKETLKFEPTIIYPVTIDEEIVRKELFCPLLPVVKFEDSNVNEVLDTMQRREHPLAFYLFTKNIKWAKKIMQTIQFGGGCVNEVCYHLVVNGVSFNGVGHSGMGAYHGVWGFREFTHPCTVLFGKTKFNLSLREHPYTKSKENLIKKFLK